jgi:hypothetical protein
MANSRHVGTAGEHLVAYELSRFGITCVLVPSGSLGVDILATVDGSKTLAIQVKASEGNSDPRKWAVGKRKPNASESFFFVFANIWADHSKKPVFYVVPSELVSKRVKWEASWPTFRLVEDEPKKYEGWNQVNAYFGLK